MGLVSERALSDSVAEPFKILWICIMDGLELSSSNIRHLVAGRNPEERREDGEIRNLVFPRESGHRDARERGNIRLEEGGPTQEDR